MKRITLAKPDDWHLHLRDGALMGDVVGMSAQQMGRAIIMPNLLPPVTKAKQAMAYRKKIIGSLPKGSSFNPLMTLYLTDNTTKKKHY